MRERERERERGGERKRRDSGMERDEERKTLGWREMKRERHWDGER